MLSSFIAVLTGLILINRLLKRSPDKIEDNIYSVAPLNSSLKALEQSQKKHDLLINYINELKMGESLDKDKLQELMPDTEFFTENLPMIASAELWEKLIMQDDQMKFKTDGKARWAILQKLKVSENKNELIISLHYYLRNDHHHLYVVAKTFLTVNDFEKILISDIYPEDNEYFVPVSRALKYSKQYLEINQNKAFLQNKYIQFYQRNSDKILYLAISFFFILLLHVLAFYIFSILDREKQQALLSEGIIRADNPFYDHFIGYKNELIARNSEINVLKDKISKTQIFKNESDNRIQILEKYKRELEHEKNRFEKISLEKVNLLSFVGHDLRAPLSNILTTSKILEKTIQDNQKAPLELIKKNAEDGLDLISGLLKSGGRKTGEENFKINLLIEESISLCENLANEKHIQILFPINQDEFVVQAQKLQLKQMLLNLIRNAIKYSPENTSVSINVFKHKILPRNIVITIKDQGPGIPQSELENVFKSYYRLSRDNQIDGSGVGLSFCRQICLQHGGTITAHSDGRSGTVFEISLPIFMSPEIIGNDSLIGLNQEVRGVNDNEIIIIEDNQETSNIMAEKLEAITKSIHKYYNGDQLLRKLKLYPDLLKLTKVIILDFEVPGTKGIDLINKLSTYMPEKAIPIVFFSGKIESIGSAAKMKAAQIFSKKTDFKLLYSYVEELFLNHNKIKNILVIDDSEDIHYLLDIFFKDGPIEINAVFCKTLVEAFDLIRKNPKFWDTILTDLNIGQEKGEDLLRFLSEENLKGKMKVIAMSAMVDEKKRLELINFGFSEVVSKEFDQEIINSILLF